MDSQRFDAFTSIFSQPHSRRRTVRLVTASLLGASGLGVLARGESTARRRKKGGKGGKSGGKGTGGGTGGGPKKDLSEICDPEVDVCRGQLQCGAPTTRHTCSSTVEGIEAWCCVPPGGACSECDCCGNFYCTYDDDNNPTCQPNPEG